MLTPLVVHSATGCVFPCMGGYPSPHYYKSPTSNNVDLRLELVLFCPHLTKTLIMQTRLLLSIFFALCTMNIMATPSRRGTNYCSNGAKIDKDENTWAFVSGSFSIYSWFELTVD